MSLSSSTALPDHGDQYTDTFAQGRWEEKKWRRKQAPEDAKGDGRLKDRKGKGKMQGHARTKVEENKGWMQREARKRK